MAYAHSQRSGRTVHNVFGLAYILGRNYFSRIIVSLTTKTSLYPHLAMPPHIALQFVEWELIRERSEQLGRTICPEQNLFPPSYGPSHTNLDLS